jgi:transcriptional regulator with XRE-family HTH domain
VASASGDEQRDEAPGPTPAAGGRPRIDSSNPTIRQRELGLRLREFRNARGMTVEDVAGHLLCSMTKISRLETGARRVSQRDVRDLCELYGVTDPADRDYLMSLAKQSREAGWWRQYDDLGLDPFIGLEQEASAITSFSMYYVPGLLQTADYARAIVLGVIPKISPEILDQRVEARLKRQLILDRLSPPNYRVLLDEAVLHRKIGSADVMTAQLDKLLERIEDRKVTLQVVPFSFGAHSGTESNFDMLEFSDEMRQGPVVYVEGLVGNNYHERPADIRRYREAIDSLRDAALGPRDSAALIASIRASNT